MPSMCAAVTERIPLEDRFWPKVNKTATCWLWTARISSTGYGAICRGGKGNGWARAHRVAWELTYGPIPDGLDCLHRCDVRTCVRPSHLFLGTRADNIADMVAKRRNAHGDRAPVRQHPERYPRGEASHHARLTAALVRTVRALDADGRLTRRQIAAKVGVTSGHVGAIVRREAWAHVE